jgi:hypothetical protein
MPGEDATRSRAHQNRLGILGRRLAPRTDHRILEAPRTDHAFLRYHAQITAYLRYHAQLTAFLSDERSR